MVEVVEIAKNYLSALSPFLIIILSILATGAFIKWGYRIAEAFRNIMKHPAYVLLVIVIAVALFYFYNKFAAPHLEALSWIKLINILTRY